MIDHSEIRLFCEQKTPLKSLAGYRKHHRLPEKGEVVSDQFLATIAHEDVDQDLNETFARLRSEFGFKRKELTATEPIGTFGEIRTPGFTYEVSISTIPGEATNVLWRRAISKIGDADLVSSSQFASAFGNQFDSLELTVEEPICVEDVIDNVEDCEDESVSVNYEKDATWCRIEFRGQKESVRVEANRIRIQSGGDTAPVELIETFLSVHQRFFSTAD